MATYFSRCILLSKVYIVAQMILVKEGKMHGSIAYTVTCSYSCTLDNNSTVHVDIIINFVATYINTIAKLKDPIK